MKYSLLLDGHTVFCPTRFAKKNLYNDMCISEQIMELDGKRVGIVMTKSEMNHSGKVLRGSFIELYRSLGLLKDYW